MKTWSPTRKAQLISVLFHDTGKFQYRVEKMQLRHEENCLSSISLKVDTQLITAILRNRVKGWTGFPEKFQTLFEGRSSSPPREIGAGSRWKHCSCGSGI